MKFFSISVAVKFPAAMSYINLNCTSLARLNRIS